MGKPSASTSPRALADYAKHHVAAFGGSVHAFGSLDGNEKHPLAKGGVATATNDPAEIERLCANPKATGYAHYVGPGFMVVDCDVDGAKNGVVALAKLAAEHGQKVPITATVSSPRGNGSQHLIFRVAETIPSSNGKIAPGIDIRGNDGAYWIAGPGSRTSKGEYTYKHGPEKIADAPQWLLDAAKAARKGKVRGAVKKALPPYHAWDMPENIAAFRRWLETEARTGTDGVDGNDTLTATGAMGSSYALHEETTVQLMADVWNPRCNPPWDGDKLEDHAGSGYRSAEHVGNKCVAIIPQDHSVIFREARNAKLRLAAENGELIAPASRGDTAEDEPDRLYYLDQLDDMRDPEYLIDGLLVAGDYNLFYGPRSTRKSFVALDMALCIATGTPYHGHDVKRGRVLYLAGEGGGGNKFRVKAWFRSRNLNRADFARDFALHIGVPKFDTAAGNQEAQKIVRSFTKHGPMALMVTDTLSRAMAEDENSPSNMRRWIDGSEAICDGAAHLAVHHAGKDVTKGARGAGTSENDASTVFMFSIKAGNTIATCTKMKDGEDGFALKFSAGKITLGQDKKGKPITSLSLTLAGEGPTEPDDDDDSAPAKAKERAIFVNNGLDQAAYRYLCTMTAPTIKRRDIASIALRDVTGDLFNTDPPAFAKALHAYDERLKNSISTAHILGPCVAERDTSARVIYFRNPTARGISSPPASSKNRVLVQPPNAKEK